MQANREWEQCGHPCEEFLQASSPGEKALCECARGTLLPRFQNGDIVRTDAYPKQWFRISEVADHGDGWAVFEPICRSGKRDRRWDVGFSGGLQGFQLVKRAA